METTESDQAGFLKIEQLLRQAPLETQSCSRLILTKGSMKIVRNGAKGSVSAISNVKCQLGHGEKPNKRELQSQKSLKSGSFLRNYVGNQIED